MGKVQFQLPLSLCLPWRMQHQLRQQICRQITKPFTRLSMQLDSESSKGQKATPKEFVQEAIYKIRQTNVQS